MKKTVYVCIISIIMSLFCPFVSVNAEEVGVNENAELLAALGVCGSDIAAKDYITRGQFAEYIMNIYYGGKASADDAVSFALENGYINNASSGSFEPDMNIRNDVAIKAVVDILGYSFNVKNADDYWTEAGRLKLTKGLEKEGFLTGAECAELLAAALKEDAYVFSGISGEDVNLERKEAIKAFFDIRIVKGTVTKVEDRGLTGGKSVGKNCIKIDNTVYEYEFDMLPFLGMNVKAYVREKDDIIVYAEDNSRNSVTITDNVIDRDTSTINEIVTYDGDRKISYKLDRDVDVVINGKGRFGYTLKDLLPEYGSLTLVDNDGNGRYEVVRVESYTTVAVNYIETTNRTIGDFYGNDIKNLSEYDSLEVTRDGREAYFSELLQDDVVGVAADEDKSHAVIKATSDKVYGAISSLSGDEIAVDGKKYEFAPFYKNLPKDKKPSVSVGDDIIAGLDMYGRVAHIRQNSNKLLKYGYMVNAYVSDHGKNMMKIFTSSGEMLTYSVVDKAKINDSLKFTNESVRAVLGNGTKVTPQLIKYSINGKNEIVRIYSSNSDKLSCDFDFANRSEASGSRVFSDNGDFMYTTSTVIFSVPDPDIDSDDSDYAVVRKALPEVTAYDYTKIAAYDVDSFGIAKAVVSRTSADINAKITSDIKRDTPLLIVTDIMTCISDDDEIMQKICGYDKESKKEYYIRENKYSLIDNVEKGDAIICLRDSVTDYVTDVLIVNKASDSKYFIAKDKIGTGKIPYYEVLRGKVYNRLGSVLRVSTADKPSKESDYKLYPASGAAVFVVENDDVRYGNIGEIQIGDEVLIRARASVIWEVIIYR